MHKSLATVLSIFFITAIVFLGLYAMGVFDGDGVSYVDSAVYGNGEFVYRGELKNGRFNGPGSVTMKSGSVYSGGFTDGRFSGYGAFYSAAGWSFEGNFKDGLIDGDGIFKSGSLIFPGSWERGAPIVRYEN